MEPSPKHGLTPVSRQGKHAGWIKRVNKKPKWICSAADAPTGAAADAYWERHFTDIWTEPEPEVAGGQELTVRYLVNSFLLRKKNALEAGDLHRRTYDEYRDALEDFVKVVGGGTGAEELAPADFGRFRDDTAKRFGPDRLAKWLVKVRGLLKFSLAQRLLDRPADVGDGLRCRVARRSGRTGPRTGRSTGPSCSARRRCARCSGTRTRRWRR
jgi:hypothetical protein